MAVEPGHSLPCTRLPFPNWKNILLTPLKTHCWSKASHQNPRPRHRVTLNPQCLFTEKFCEGCCAQSGQWTQGLGRQALHLHSAKSLRSPALLFVMATHKDNPEVLLPAHRLERQDALKEQCFWDIFYISKQWTIWCGGICTDLLTGSILFNLYIVKFSQACTPIHPTLHLTQAWASRFLWELFT